MAGLFIYYIKLIISSIFSIYFKKSSLFYNIKIYRFAKFRYYKNYSAEEVVDIFSDLGVFFVFIHFCVMGAILNILCEYIYLFILFCIVVCGDPLA